MVAGLAWLSIGAFAVAPTPTPAVEAEPTLALSPIQYSGDIPRHLEPDIHAAVLDALAERSIHPLDAGARSCRGLGCALRKARDAELAHVVVVHVYAEERDFQIMVEARAASDGRVEFRNKELCELCGHHELLAIVTAQVRAIAGLVERGGDAPMLQIHGSPNDAMIVLDGEALGPAPLELEVEPGRHRVDLGAPGYTRRSYRWEASAGIEEVIDYRLSAPRVHGGGARVGGWIGFALGVAGVGVGGALLAIDGREFGPTCAEDRRDARGACPDVYETSLAGTVTAAVGGATLLTGAGLLVYDSRRDEPGRNRPIFEIGGSPGGLSLRF